MEVGVGGEGVDGRWEEKAEVEMEVGGGSKGWEVGGEGGGGSRSTGGRCDVEVSLWMVGSLVCGWVGGCMGWWRKKDLKKELGEGTELKREIEEGT